MEATSSDSIFNKMFNPEIFKLDRFDGINFTRWKDKLFFLLTELGVAYLLSGNLPTIPEPSDKDTDEVIAARKKRNEDEVCCRGFILNALSDRLYDLFRTIKSPQEIWNAMENKYTSEKQGTDKFINMKFFEFRMIDNKPIMPQVDALLVLVSRLKDLKVDVSEPLQVAAVIAKLPTFWNNYRKKLLHTTEDFSIEKLTKHIRIEEETRNRESKFALDADSKVNYVESGTKNNGNKAGHKSGNKRKYNDYSANNKKNKSCFFCGKNGHFKKECRFYKKLKTEENAEKKKANVVEHQSSSTEIIAMIADLKINMITECNMTTIDNSTEWWYDSGATMHVCHVKNLFKTYDVATKEEMVFMGNHDTAKVFGKGTIELQFTSGKKLILLNVFHVPDVRKNLISASLLCKKGIKAVLEADKVIFSKNGVFVGQAYSCDGMFKLSINKVDVSVYVLDSSFNLWHARLSHVNFRSIKFMSNHGLISCNNENTNSRKCEICIQEKMTKKPFPKNERTT